MRSRHPALPKRYAQVATRLPLAIVLLTACSPEPSAAPEPATGRPADPAVAVAQIEQGKYLVDNVILCMNCHSQRDWTLYSGPIVPGTEGAGGIVGIFEDDTVAPAISPQALADWSDGEIVGAIIGGRDRSGSRIHGGWMLSNLSILTEDDTNAIVAYLRHSDDPSIVARGHEPQPGQDRGAYLMAIGRCQLCHGEDLSGGTPVEVPGQASLLSANISIDVATGVGRMNRTEFIDYFKSLSGPEFARVAVPADTPNTAMAWPQMSQMTRDDLGAIYDLIASRPAVTNRVPTP